MPIDILGIFKQVRDFIKEEKGTLFMLITFLFLGFFFTQFIYTSLKVAGIAPNFLYILGIMSLLIFIYWIRSRAISLSKSKTNIAIAHMPVGNIDAKSQLTEDQKITLSEELVNFIYGSLEHESQKLGIHRFLHFVKLPYRIKIDYNNNEKFPYQIGTEILVWGLLRYNKEKIFYNSKFEFSKSINSDLFYKLEHDVKASPEMEYSLNEDENLGLKKFLHIITYIGLIFHTLKLMNEDRYGEAEQLMNLTLNNLQILYDDKSDKSVERGDQDLLAIEARMYYVKAKNLHNWGNELLQNFDFKNEANEKFIQAGKALTSQGDLLIKYLNQSHKENSPVIVEHSYIYAVSLLAKAGSKEEAASILQRLRKIGVNEEKIRLTKALIATKFENFDHAEKTYLQCLEDDENNTIALRGLGMFYYDNHRDHEAKVMLKKLQSITLKHIFHPEIYDTSVQKTLMIIYLRNGNILEAAKNYIKMGLYNSRNNLIQKNQYIL